VPNACLVYELVALVDYHTRLKNTKIADGIDTKKLECVTQGQHVSVGPHAFVVVCDDDAVLCGM
jgi:hypothetical protein